MFLQVLCLMDQCGQKLHFQPSVCWSWVYIVPDAGENIALDMNYTKFWDILERILYNIEPPLQMMPKQSVPINPFVAAAGVISRPYRWLDL